MTPDPRGIGALRWIRRRILPIADSHDHPIRRWMDKRNLWRSELPLPPSLRWVPADAPVFRGSHSGIGAIAFPLAPISAWRTAYPETPSPAAVQLVCIDSDGEKADYANSQGNRVDMPRFGNARLAVWTIRDVRYDSVSVCDGCAQPSAAENVIDTLGEHLQWRSELLKALLVETGKYWPTLKKSPSWNAFTS